jgi:hypothetical protein
LSLFLVVVGVVGQNTNIYDRAKLVAGLYVLKASSSGYITCFETALRIFYCKTSKNN